MSVSMLYGTIVGIGSRFIDVKLYTSGQIVKMVRTSSLDLDESEEEQNINAGIEVLCLVDTENGSGAVIASSNQGTTVAGNKTTKIANDTIKITNGSDDIIHLLSDLAQAVADTTPVGGSSDGKPNKEKDNALAIKAKIDAFK